MELSIVKPKGGCRWAIKAVVDNEVRYRGFYYKQNAVANLSEWQGYRCDDDFMRDFHHNFHSAEELGIKGEL